MHRRYTDALKSVLSPAEHRIFFKLDNPQKVQDYLDRLPINFELSGETYMSPRRVIKEKRAHCLEGALLAAAAFAFHGRSPLLMDFQTVPEDEDHVVAVFQQSGMWGAISKTNHAILRYRDPVYKSPRELAMSYFHEYLEWDGSKSLRAYSKPFDLSKFSPKKWVTEVEDLAWVVDSLDTSPHFPVAPKKNLNFLRRATAVELRAMKTVEWSTAGRRYK